MDDVRNPELTRTMPDLGGLVQVSSDATRRLCEHGQSVANTISASAVPMILEMDMAVPGAGIPLGDASMAM